MKRYYLVKVKGTPPFSMIIIEDGEEPEAICRAIFGDDRFEWVR